MKKTTENNSTKQIVVMVGIVLAIFIVVQAAMYALISKNMQDTTDRIYIDLLQVRTDVQSLKKDTQSK
jgi:hypothetical protein